ncbi:MAG: glycosyltransferase family 4 protein [Planctomycetota bacterium]|nr:glycosyltransferase family 4 protein [Planctomycetota bacterium]
MSPKDIPTVIHLGTAATWRGGENQILLLCIRLRDRGVRCIVAAPPGSVLLARASEEGIETEALRIACECDPIGAARLARAVRRCGARIIHAHDARGVLPARAAAIFAGGARAKVVAHRRTAFDVRGAWKYRLCTDAVIAISRASRDGLTRAGVPEAKIRVVYSGLPSPPRPPGSPGAVRARERIRKALGLRGDRIAVLCVAGLTEEKGHSTLFRAMHLIPPPRPLLLLAGTGELEGRLREEAEEAGLAEDVRFLGFRRRVSNLMLASDIFAITSLSEGLCTSLIDAQMHGLPAVATCAGGMSEVVEGEHTGLLVPVGDAGAVAAAISRLASDSGLRRRMGAAGMERASRLFSADAMAGGVLEVYRELTGRP